MGLGLPGDPSRQGFGEKHPSLTLPTLRWDSASPYPCLDAEEVVEVEKRVETTSTSAFPPLSAWQQQGT